MTRENFVRSKLLFPAAGSFLISTLLFGSPYLHLESLRIKVNENEVYIPSGGELSLWKGDKITILEGQIKGRKLLTERINFIGFRSKAFKRNYQDDTNVEIDTSTLNFSSDKRIKSRTYNIHASRKNRLVGVARIQIKTPELQKLSFLIDGEPLELKNQDQVKISRSALIQVVGVHTLDNELDKKIRIEFSENVSASGAKVIEAGYYYQAYKIGSVYFTRE